MDSLFFKDSGKTQFQEIKMQLQHGRNPNSRSSYWKGTNSKGIENTYQDQGS